VQDRAGKDAKTLLIARALAVFVVVLAAGALLLVLADRLGADALDPLVRVLTATAALAAAVFVLRRD
jgi:hypothetical protein